MSRLMPRQRRFVAEYLVDLNATQAAIRAGYSPKTAAQIARQLLQKTSVSDAVATGAKKITDKAEVTAEGVLKELLILLNSDVRHFQIDDNGRLTLAPDAPDTAWRAVSSVKHRTIVSGTGERARVTHEVEFRLWDKPAAARMLGEHLALYRQRLEHSGPGGGPIEVRADELRSRLTGRIAGVASRLGMAGDHRGPNGHGTSNP